MLKKKIMAYVHQLLDQPSQWQTSQQAGPCSVPKFTNTSITVKHLLIKNKNINQSKSSLLIWHYVSYLFLFRDETWNTHIFEPPHDKNQQNDLCAQRRLVSAWSSAQSDQSLSQSAWRSTGSLSIRGMHSGDFYHEAAHIFPQLWGVPIQVL